MDKAILETVCPYIEYVGSFLSWYFWKIAIYPGTVLLTCIILQYVAPYQSKTRFFAVYGVYFVFPAFLGIYVWPFFVINVTKGCLNSLYGAYLLRPVSWIVGIEFEYRNVHNIAASVGPAVIVANHQSFFDVCGMFNVWHVMVRCTAIARKKIFYIWPFGLLAWLAGVIFIDRIPAYDKTLQKVNKAADIICKQNAKLWMFPEGTRNKNPERLMPFKKGAFRVAITCQLPIIPVVFSPYYFINGKTFYFGKGKVIVEALDPIPTNDLTLKDIDALMDKVYKLMSAKNDELRAYMKSLKEKGQLPCCRNL